ncbi:MAG: hypothetical protein DRP89_08050 [Candidatus Neomarinimicrobiota bacterium]|nr:MAG: hypothetical protein DRP89_08050 [Candidatus Neomarinimicrobiota bacterium]
MGNEYIIVTCKKCGKKYKVKAPDTPKRYRCSNCGQIISVEPRTGNFHKTKSDSLVFPDKKFYEIVIQEIKKGKIKRELRSNALAEAPRDKERAKSLYIKWRIQQLKEEVAAKPLYVSVSKQKFFLFSLLTSNFYEFYWFYKNWELIKKRTGRKISPFWRTWFSPFFCLDLFMTVKESAEGHDVPTKIHPGWLALVYFILFVAYILLRSTALCPPYFLIFVWLLMFLPLFSILSLMERINLKIAPHVYGNDYDILDVITIILGGTIFWLLSILSA